MFLLSLATSVTSVLHVCPWPLLELLSDHIAGIVADAAFGCKVVTDQQPLLLHICPIGAT